MALTKEGVAAGYVQDTGRVSKLTIDGVSNNYRVYRIKLDQLYYNAQNDRIATWMSLYRKDHDGQAPDTSDRKAFNDIVGGFIEQSNPDALKKTRNNIKLFGQEVPAIVLEDGLIIDGNRRFTCLRQLAQDDEKFNWIDAMVLPQEMAQDRRRIKKLELAIQFGQEGKVDYNPIDRLVGIYNDILKNRLLTTEEYAKSANMTVREVNSLVEQANLMAQFLEFCNAPEQFFLARDLEISGPIMEIPRLLKKCPGDDEREEVRNCIFANMVVEPRGDITRFVRRFKPVLESPAAPDFVRKETDLAAEVSDRLAEMPVVDTAGIREHIRGDKKLVQQFNDVMDKADTQAKASKLLAAPAENILNAAHILEGIDGTLFGRLPEDERMRALQGLDAVIDAVEGVRRAIEEACGQGDEA